MILLAISIAISNEHARLARLETDAFILAALSAAALCRHCDTDVDLSCGQGQTAGTHTAEAKFYNDAFHHPNVAGDDDHPY
jgi:collagenase-like PrtC family protease